MKTPKIESIVNAFDLFSEEFAAHWITHEK